MLSYKKSYIKILKQKKIYALIYCIVFTDNYRQTEYMHCHISIYLQTNADLKNICIPTFHYIYRQLQTKTIYALPYFSLFTDNFRPNQYMHCHISLYLQTTADQLIICTTIFHCIYRQLQTNLLYALPYFIVFTDNCRTTEYMLCLIIL